MPSDVFRELVKGSSSYTEILAHFGLKNRGGNPKTLHARIAAEGVDDSHIKHRQMTHAYRREAAAPLEDIMVEHSPYSRYYLKKRILKTGFLAEKCAICGMNPEWNGEPLVLILDHINGVNDDHRPENLRLLCPNCNSQTGTFAGRNRQRKQSVCSECGTPITGCGKTGMCLSCYRKQTRVVERPPKNVLLEQIERLGYVGTSRIYGVTDNAIRKWL